MLRKLIAGGVDVFRLNFSHGSHAEHSEVLNSILTISEAVGQHVGILQDLCGPKIRLGPIPGDLVECPLGSEFRLVASRTSEDPRELTCSYAELVNDLHPGETVLFADGTVAMRVIAGGPGFAQLKVVLPGRLRSKQGINLPGRALNVPSLTEKDLADLDWTAAHALSIQYVGLSFVRSAVDVECLRRELRARNCSARILVKIEKPQAVDNLEAIIAAADAAMVARGDLGVELDVFRVPAIQKHAISMCNAAHRPVITATQMLNSMEHSSTPTRAEATDVFNAVLDGTDAVMLSGETAIGEYPEQTVRMMRQICEQAEDYLARCQQTVRREKPASLEDLVQPITEAMVDAACAAADQLGAPLIVALTFSGRTALALSNRRPASTILALTQDAVVARALSLCWGVAVRLADDLSSVEKAAAEAITWARQQNLIAPGQHVVLLRGELPGQSASREVLIRQVPES
jgi:pyruvate kinase